MSLKSTSLHVCLFFALVGVNGAHAQSATAKAAGDSGPPRASASRSQDYALYQQLVASRFKGFEVRFSALEKRVGAMGDKAKSRVTRNNLRDLREYLDALKASAGKLSNAAGSEWDAQHDEIEAGFRHLVNGYRDVMAQVSSASPNGDDQIAGMDVSAGTPYAQHTRQRLKAWESRVDALQQAVSGSGTVDVQNDLSANVRNMRARIFAAAEGLRMLDAPKEGGSWAELHDRIEDNLNEISSDYARAVALLPARTRTAMGGSSPDAAEPVFHPFSEKVVGQLERYRLKLDGLEQMAWKADKESRENLLNEIKRLRQTSFETAERARTYERMENQVDRAKTREEVEAAVQELGKDFQALSTKLSAADPKDK